VRYGCQYVNKFGSAPVRGWAWEELNFRRHPYQMCDDVMEIYIGVFFENMSRKFKFFLKSDKNSRYFT